MRPGSLKRLIRKGNRFFKLALRNLVRYQRRSFLTGMVMAVSVGAIILASAMGEAFYHQLVNVGIKTTTGHLQVFPTGWDFDIISPQSGDIPKLTNTRELEKIISQSPFFKAMGREILYQTMFYDEKDRYFYGTIIGVEPDKAKETLEGIKIMKGATLSEGTREGMLISPVMWLSFRPEPGEMMYILTGGPMGMMEGVKARYMGIARSMPLFAERVAFTSIERVQRLLGWRGDECVTIKVILTDKERADFTASWLKNRFKGLGLPLEVKTWKELGGFYYHIALLGRVLVFFLLLIMAAITAITVSNTMLMSIKERTREIGTMMAMGLKRKGVLILFLMESFTLSLIATAGGVILGAGITLWFQHQGIVKGLALVLEGKLLPQLGFYPVLFSFLWILSIGTLGGLYPAYKAGRLDPIEALRYT